MHAEIIKRLEEEFGLRFQATPDRRKKRAYFKNCSNRLISLSIKCYEKSNCH